MVAPLSLDHVLSLSYLQIIAGTYNSSVITMTTIMEKALWMEWVKQSKMRYLDKWNLAEIL